MFRRFAVALSICLAVTVGSAFAKTPEEAIYLSPAEIEEIRQGSACKNFVRQIIALKKRMSTTGIETDFYDLRVIPTTELVKGKAGTYYAVVLKDARRKRRFRFPGGRYVIKRFNTRFRASLAAFTRDVLAPLQSGVEYELYVRGSASARPMRRSKRQSKKMRFESVEFLPRVGEELYDANAKKSRDVPKRYGNEDLPYLRAAFLQKIVGETIQFAKPKMLQSVVSESKARAEQYAEILLFVSWR